MSQDCREKPPFALVTAAELSGRAICASSPPSPYVGVLAAAE